MLQFSGLRQVWPGLQGPVCRAFLTLVLLDLLFMGINIVAKALSWLDVTEAVPRLLDVTQDHALPETFNYLKWAFCVSVFAEAWVRVRARIYLALAVVFLAIFLDDALQIHENVGHLAARTFGLRGAFGLRAKDFGEILYFVALGTVALSIIVLSLRHGGTIHAEFGRLFVLLLFVLALFGGVADAIHMLTITLRETLAGRAVDFAVGLVEDGGEMIAASAAVALAVGVRRLTVKES